MVILDGNTLSLGKPATTIHEEPDFLGTSGLVIGASTVPFTTIGTGPTTTTSRNFISVANPTSIGNNLGIGDSTTVSARVEASTEIVSDRKQTGASSGTLGKE